MTEPGAGLDYSNGLPSDPPSSAKGKERLALVSFARLDSFSSCQHFCSDIWKRLRRGSKDQPITQLQDQGSLLPLDGQSLGAE